MSTSWPEPRNRLTPESGYRSAVNTDGFVSLDEFAFTAIALATMTRPAHQLAPDQRINLGAAELAALGQGIGHPLDRIAVLAYLFRSSRVGDRTESYSRLWQDGDR